jgi:hypothetical protein
MAEPLTTLAVVNQRMYELIREYDALPSNHLRAAEILEELSEFSVVRAELQKIESKVKAFSKAGLVMPAAEFPTIEALYRRINSVARQIAETRRDDPRRQDPVNELTRLSILADSLKKEKE